VQHASTDTATDVIADEELTALALAADPEQALDDDAVPFLPWRAPGDGDTDLLPAWYMPEIGQVAPRRWHAPVVAPLVAALLIIPAFGFCITYGSLVLA